MPYNAETETLRGLAQNPAFAVNPLDGRWSSRPSTFDNVNHAKKTEGGVERIFTTLVRAESIGESVAHRVAETDAAFGRSREKRSSYRAPVALPLFAGPRRKSNLDLPVCFGGIGLADHKAATFRKRGKVAVKRPQQRPLLPCRLNDISPAGDSSLADLVSTEGPKQGAGSPTRICLSLAFSSQHVDGADAKPLE